MEAKTEFVPELEKMETILVNSIELYKSKISYYKWLVTINSGTLILLATYAQLNDIKIFSTVTTLCIGNIIIYIMMYAFVVVPMYITSISTNLFDFNSRDINEHIQKISGITNSMSDKKQGEEFAKKIYTSANEKIGEVNNKIVAFLSVDNQWEVLVRYLNLFSILTLFMVFIFFNDVSLEEVKNNARSMLNEVVHYFPLSK